MKVLMIGFTKIMYMPYMNFYLNQLLKSDNEISLIYWARDRNLDINVPIGVKTYCFKDSMMDSQSLITKIPHFINFRRFASKVIKKNDFDMIILMHSTPAVLLHDSIISAYKRRYIFDYRDFTYENLKLYKAIIHKIVKNSILTFVSSRGYLKYLPNVNNIYISHNIEFSSIDQRMHMKDSLKSGEAINIRFWGLIRHIEINKTIIDRLGNDSRFILHYHGREQSEGQTLKKYVKDNFVNNVYFHGEYKPADRIKFAFHTDLIHNIYDNDIKTIYAIGNKYYDGLTFRIPQICNKDSFMGRTVEAEGLGIMLDPRDLSFGDSIFKYYTSINWNDFYENCSSRFDEIINEYNKSLSILNDVLKRKKA